MLSYVLVFFAVVLRILPHLPNAAPITGLALFSGVYLKRGQAIWLPLAAMIISDFFLPAEPFSTRLSVYGAFCLVGLIGIWIRRRKNWYTIALGSIVGSCIFYLVTNFAFFYPTTMYAHNIQGVLASYYNALPFFRNTIVGDLFYTAVLFGSYELVRRLADSKKPLEPEKR